MTKEAKARKDAYIKRFQKETYANVSFKLRYKEDNDVLVKLKSVANKSEYIKKLIRQDMANGE
jgi:hypothetical protein